MSVFEKHIREFPQDLKAEKLILTTLSSIDETLVALRGSNQWLGESLDAQLYELAVAVELRAREQALNRLLHLGPENLEH